MELCNVIVEYFAGHSSCSKVLYTQNITPSSHRKTKGRYISQVPEKILDAPDFMNDYCKFHPQFLNYNGMRSGKARENCWGADPPICRQKKKYHYIIKV